MSGKHRFTVTLGGSGRVVKRAGPISEAPHSDHVALPRGKQSISERLGSHSDSYSSQVKNKRKRKENHKSSPNGGVANNDDNYLSSNWVGQHDLRSKLMHTNLSAKMELVADVQCEADLRGKLSRTSQMPLRFDARQHMLEPNESGHLRRIPPTRNANDLQHMDSLRKSSSVWNLDRLRCRSPDRLLGASRGYSPARNFIGPQQVPPVRFINDMTPITFMKKSVTDAPRPTAFMTKANVSFEAPKHVFQLSRPGGIMSKSTYPVVEPISVSSLLNSLGLGKYAILFQAEEVDMAALKQMGDNDLKELGIPMGPRKKILLGVLPRSRRHISHT